MQEGVSLSVTEKFKVSVPFIAEAGIEMTQELNFEASQMTTKGDSVEYSMSPQIAVPPHSTRSCTIWASEGTLTLDAKFTVVREYDNGCKQTVTVPMSYVSVSVFHASSSTSVVDYKPGTGQVAHDYNGNIVPDCIVPVSN
jgi:Clostridium epsilon toxin ETX/Bacillus mosquitocidal toxin MTX2